MYYIWIRTTNKFISNKYLWLLIDLMTVGSSGIDILQSLSLISSCWKSGEVFDLGSTLRGPLGHAGKGTTKIRCIWVRILNRWTRISVVDEWGLAEPLCSNKWESINGSMAEKTVSSFMFGITCDSICKANLSGHLIIKPRKSFLRWIINV